MTAQQRIRLMALWGERWRRHYPNVPVSDPRCREDRIDYLASVCGRIIESANDLSEAEAARAIAALESELPKKVLPFPNRNRITKGQIWKIRQLEAHLGWGSDPGHLQEVLRRRFQVPGLPEELSFAQGWRAIETLFAVAARAGIKAVKGDHYKVSAAELAAEIKRLKVELQGGAAGVVRASQTTEAAAAPEAS